MNCLLQFANQQMSNVLIDFCSLDYAAAIQNDLYSFLNIIHILICNGSIIHIYTAICGWVLKCILRYVKDELYLEKKILGLKNVHDRSHFVRNSMAYLLYKLTPIIYSLLFMKYFVFLDIFFNHHYRKKLD